MLALFVAGLASRAGLILDLPDLTLEPNQVNPAFFDGTLTVVPEPVNVALPVFGGMVALAGGYRWWYRRKASAC